MFCTCKDAKPAHLALGKSVFRKHPAHCMLDSIVWMTRLHSIKGNFTKSSDITGIVTIHLLPTLSTGNLNFFCIDNHNAITAIYVRSVVWAMLTTQDFTNLCCKSSQCFSFCVKEKPLTNDLFFLPQRCFICFLSHL